MKELAGAIRVSPELQDTEDRPRSNSRTVNRTVLYFVCA
jgi:hypothetical protein